MYFDMDDLDAALTHVQRSLEHFLAESHRLGEADDPQQHGAAHGAARQRHRRARPRGDRPRALRGARLCPRDRANPGLPGPRARGRRRLRAGGVLLPPGFAVLEQFGDAEVSGSIRHHLAQAYLRLRDFPNATRELRRTIALYRALGNRRLAATALADFGTLLTEAGHPTLARSLWQTALPTLTEYADPRAAEIETALGSYHEVHPR
jgi:tetratricopeptide (TPR) repeat protein